MYRIIAFWSNLNQKTHTNDIILILRQWVFTNSFGTSRVKTYMTTAQEPFIYSRFIFVYFKGVFLLENWEYLRMIIVFSKTGNNRELYPFIKLGKGKIWEWILKKKENKQWKHCWGWQMKGSLEINISFVYFQILLDDPFLKNLLVI